jgi:flagellar protein FliO/FliZ
MIFDYFLRLFILLPLVAALAWGSLWLWRRVQMGLPIKAATRRAAQIVDVLPMGPGTKLAVVDFGGKQLLVAISRGGISLLSEDSRGDFHAD